MYCYLLHQVPTQIAKCKMECVILYANATFPKTASKPTSRGYPHLKKANKKPVKQGNTSIREQLLFAQQKYQEVLSEHLNSPKHLHSSKSDEDVWAWGLFSETVLPMLLFVDDC